MLNCCATMIAKVSLPVRGAWIEITRSARPRGSHFGRSPCGERGLKLRSLPRLHVCQRRSPCGERGLKYAANHISVLCAVGRSPCGERGLKFPTSSRKQGGAESLPVRGAWIEIAQCQSARKFAGVAPRAGSVD